jgi:superfamily II DNA or RNA helicase
VLFVAHRDEILDQAMRTFRTIRPQAVLGKYTGTEKVLDADATFASIQTLGGRATRGRERQSSPVHRAQLSVVRNELRADH